MDEGRSLKRPLLASSALLTVHLSRLGISMFKPNAMANEFGMHPGAKEPSIEAEWEKGRALAGRIEGAGGMKAWVEKNSEEAAAAFPEQVAKIGCMDERVVDQMEDAVYVAGSGILDKNNPDKTALLIRHLRENGVKNVTMHKGCGACALFQKANNLSDEQLAREVDAWGRTLAAELGGEYEGVVDVTPKDFHTAHVMYYDTTGRFNPSTAPGVFPSGFVIGRHYLDSESALAQAEVGIGIAHGAHGYGKRFDDKNRFTVIAVANDAALLEKAEKEIEALKKLGIATDGFVRPR